MGDPSKFVSSAVAGFIAGLLVCFRAHSFALVYFGALPLAGNVSLMGASLLLSTAVSQLVYSYFHEYPGVISCAASTAVPFQSIMAEAIVARVEPAAAVVTVMVAFSIIGVAWAAFVILLSFLPNLDLIKRLFPPPVMCAFFCICGVGMLENSLELVYGGPLGWALLDGPNAVVSCLQLFFALLAGVANRFGAKFLKHFSILPLCLTFQMVLFYAVLARSSDMVSARVDAWLWYPFPQVSFQAVHFSLVDWSAIVAQSHHILWLLMMLVLDLLSTLLPLEKMTASKRSVMKDEFRITGYASAISSCFLGSASYVSLSPTRLNVEAGGVHKLSGIVSAATCVIWIVVGPSVTAYIPKFVVGGLLNHVAFGYLLDGLWESRSVMSGAEHTFVFNVLLYYLGAGGACAVLFPWAMFALWNSPRISYRSLTAVMGAKWRHSRLSQRSSQSCNQ